MAPRERNRLIAKTVLTSAAVLGLLVLAYSLTPGYRSSSNSVALRMTAAIVIVALATVLALRSVSRADYPVLRAVETVVLLVGLLLVGFAGVYLRASAYDATSFSEPLDHTGALYFALTSATTVGFGDIAPRSNPARIAAMVQMVCNVVVIGVVTRLVIGTAQRRSRRAA